jgi:hypothetical protein
VRSPNRFVRCASAVRGHSRLTSLAAGLQHRARPRNGHSARSMATTDARAGGENFSTRLQVVPCRGRTGLRRTACAAATLPLRSRAAARLWAAGHAPAREAERRRVAVIPAGRSSSYMITRSQPRCAPRSRRWRRWQNTRRFSPWSGSGIGGSGLTPRDHAKSRPGSRGMGRSGLSRLAPPPTQGQGMPH